MYIPMIDTLIVSLDIESFVESLSKIHNNLDKKKNEAKNILADNLSKLTNIEIGDMTFEVLPNGKRGYSYILHNDFYEIDLAQFRSKNKDMYPINIKIKSECLWSLSPQKAWDKIYDWVNTNLGAVCSIKLSRIDLCCHIDNFKLDLEDIGTFKGQFYTEHQFQFRRKLTSMNFGSSASGKIYARLYNKYFEVVQKKQKTWFFDIWKNKKMKAKNVWNVEFQVCREYLKEHGIETVGQAFECLGSIWRYCTNNWLVKIENDNSRVTRCSINDKWIEIQKAFDGYFKHEPLVKREKQLSSEIESMIPGTMGNITTLCAKAGITDEHMGFEILKIYSKTYFENKDLDFKEVVRLKKALINSVDNDCYESKFIDIDFGELLNIFEDFSKDQLLLNSKIEKELEKWSN